MKKSISYISIIIIIGFVVYYLMKNWESVKSISWWENPQFIFVHIVLLFFTFFLFIIGWHRLLRSTGNDLSISVSAYTWLIPNLGKYIPGKVFMVAGRVALLNQLGIRKSMVICNVIWEHVFIIISIIPFICIILLSNAGIFSSKIFITSICLIILVLLMILNPKIIQKVINYFLRILKKPPLEFSLEPKKIIKFVFFYLVTWGVYGFTGVTLAYAFGFANRVSMVLFYNVYIFSWFLGFISIITPGGLGVREGVLILMISPYIPVSELIIYTLFARVTWTITELCGVLVGMQINNKLSA